MGRVHFVGGRQRVPAAYANGFSPLLKGTSYWAAHPCLRHPVGKNDAGGMTAIRMSINAIDWIEFVFDLNVAA